MVVFELVRAGLDFLGVNGTLAIGIAVVLVGVYYSRELAGFLAKAAQVLSIATIILGGLGIGAVLGLSMGWIQIDGGLVGSVLRAVGGLIH